MKPLTTFITELEKEIKQQTYLLDRYISEKDWRKAGAQQEYINGLAYALHIAMASYGDHLRNLAWEIETNEIN